MQAQIGEPALRIRFFTVLCQKQSREPFRQTASPAQSGSCGKCRTVWNPLPENSA